MERPRFTPDLVFDTLPTEHEPFPEGFLWGAAASSYQIEGHGNTGIGESVCDMVYRDPFNSIQGDNASRGAGHVEQMESDVAIMGEVGLQAYRFSISWVRVMPDGETVSEAGLGFYDRLVDKLLEAGIQPWATLFHWDYPITLFRRGGWQNPQSPEWFAHYTEAIVKRLGDRVTNWLTLNEPQVFVGLGHEMGQHPPGLKMERRELLRVAHNVLLAHGRAVQVIREHGKPAKIGWASVGAIGVPASESPEDIEAARRATLSYPEKPLLPNPWDNTILWNNTFWADPVIFGDYPEDARRVLGKDLPEMSEADRAIISEPIDFYGANIYHGKIFKMGADGQPEAVQREPGFPLTLFKWPVTPEALYWGPKFLYERYQMPIYVTENGMSGHDWPDSIDGSVHDPARIDFVRRYLHALRWAIRDGVPVKSYFYWSIFDNFEWSSGYHERFGLVHINNHTLKRTPKDSASWYRKVIESNGAQL